MIDIEKFVKYLDNYFHLISGVPCTYFKEFLSYIDIHRSEIKMEHIFATREDESIGIASGVAFSGKNAIVYMQNSGLGNIGDALTSLAQLYKLPMLILISYRGQEDDKDFPEHSIMGDVNESILKAFNISYWNLSIDNWQTDIEKAINHIEMNNLPAVLLVEKGVLC